MFRRITSSFLRIPKKARTALLVSLLVPGAGHIYNREVLKGVLLWAMAVGFLIWGLVSYNQYCSVHAMMLEHTGMADIATAQARASVPYWWMPALFYLIVTIFAAYDAYLVARQIIDLIERERRIREAERMDARSAGRERSGGATGSADERPDRQQEQPDRGSADRASASAHGTGQIDDGHAAGAVPAESERPEEAPGDPHSPKGRS